MVILIPALILLSTVLTGCSHLSYLWQAGVGQLSLYNHERKIEEVIADPATSEDLREKLRWISEIKTYVEVTLGQKATSNYNTFVKLDREYVIWSLTCADKFELKLKEWSFPVVGSFPYLGFFSENGAKNWEQECIEKGMDTYVRGVGAYSTLGYLRDPLLSSMLSRRKEDLVNLIFHESMHGVVYIKGQGSFNEQLASFIGDYGELGWIVKNYGKNSKQHLAWIDGIKRRKIFGQKMRAFADVLKNEYAQGKSVQEKEAEKNRLFRTFQAELRSAGFARTADLMVNNAVLLAFLTYEDEQDLFDRLNSKFSGDLKKITEFSIELAKTYEGFSNEKKKSLSPQKFLAEQL